MFVFLALLEYAVILYLKNMKGTHKTIVRSEVLAITKIPADDANWSNQQVTYFCEIFSSPSFRLFAVSRSRTHRIPNLMVLYRVVHLVEDNLLLTLK